MMITATASGTAHTVKAATILFRIVDPWNDIDAKNMATIIRN